MLKKHLSLLVLLAGGLSGCLHRKPAKKVEAPKEVVNSEFIKEGGTYVFNEDSDEFKLDDDIQDVFEGEGEAVDAKAESQWDNIVYDSDAGEVIQFNFDDTSIKPAEMPKVEHNAELAKQVLDQNPKAQVVCNGHSCKIAKSALYNQAISQGRAENVKNELVKHQVDPARVKAVGHGASELLTDEDGMEAQAINRRVETDFIENK